MDNDRLTAAIKAEFPAPYTFLGCESTDDRAEKNAALAAAGMMHTDNLCGGTCDRCGMSIHDVWAFRCADGRTFKLGCDCVGHVFPSLEKQGSILHKAAKKFNAKKSSAKLAHQWAQIDALASSGALDGLGHPYRADSTLAAYAAACDRTAAAASRILVAVKKASR